MKTPKTLIRNNTDNIDRIIVDKPFLNFSALIFDCVQYSISQPSLVFLSLVPPLFKKLTNHKSLPEDRQGLWLNAVVSLSRAY